MARQKHKGWNGDPYYRWRIMVGGQYYTLKLATDFPAKPAERTVYLILPRGEWSAENSLSAARDWRKRIERTPESRPELSDRMAKIKRQAGYRDKLTPEEEFVFNRRLLATVLQERLLEQGEVDPDAREMMLLLLRTTEEELGGLVDTLSGDPGKLPTDPTKMGEWVNSLKANAKLEVVVPPETIRAKTAAGIADRWLEHRSRELADGVISGATRDNSETVWRFVDFVGRESDLAAWLAESESWDRWCGNLRSLEKKGKKASTVRHWLAVSKQFVSWVARREYGTLPVGFGDKRRLGKVVGKVRDLSNDDFAALLSQGGLERCCVLLMANCGFNPVDLSDLKLVEIDWKNGYIVRTRSKMETRGDGYKVKHKLWEETLAALNEWSGKVKDGRALHLLDGRTFVRRDGGANSRYRDNSKHFFRRLFKRAGVSDSASAFRHCAASRLMSSREYSPIAQHFMGHADLPLVDKNYAVAPQAWLDEAVAWLRTDLGIDQLPK